MEKMVRNMCFRGKFVTRVLIHGIPRCFSSGFQVSSSKKEIVQHWAPGIISGLNPGQSDVPAEN